MAETIGSVSAANRAWAAGNALHFLPHHQCSYDKLLVMLEKIKSWARTIKSDVVALFIATRDQRTPLSAKVVAIGVVAYALSPIDLIPDFIPVIGYLDDLLILPLGIILAVRLIPSRLMAEYREQASSQSTLPISRAGAAFVILIWIGSVFAIGWWLTTT